MGGKRLPGLLVALLAALAAGVVEGLPRPWDLLRHETPRVLWVGLKHDIVVRVHNTGRGTWSEPSGDHLSYHWRSRTGEVVRYDGHRSSLAAPLEPGAVADVVARVEAPKVPGRYVIEWEMVRENVGWYGPPAGGARIQVPVIVMRRHVLLQVVLVVIVVAVALGLRRVGVRDGGVAPWLALAVVPLLLAWAGFALLQVTFSELSSFQLWVGGGLLVASSSALLALPVALAPVRARAWVAGGVLLLGAGIALADLAYMRFFGSVVPVVAVAAVRQVGQIEGSIGALLRRADLWLLPGAAAVVLLAVVTSRRTVAAPSRAVRRAVWVGGVVACLLGTVPAVAALRAAYNNPARADQLFSQEMRVGEWGVANVHLFDLVLTVREWRGATRPSPEQEARLASFFTSRDPAEVSREPLFGAARGANLLLIQVESLQQWVVGATVGGKPVMPFLTSLGERGLLFSNVFDQSGQGRSSDGEFIVMNSLHSLDRGAVVFRRPHNDYVALPAVLRAQGYATLSAHPFDRGFWNRALLHPRYGFEKMLFRKELAAMGSGEVIGWGLADEPFFARMVPEIGKLPQPFFAFLITLGLHHPFDLFPERHKVLDVGEIKDTPLGNYVHAMHYLDDSLRGLVTALERAGLMQNTVLALYGDHEAGLGVDAGLIRLAGIPRWDPSLPVRLQKVPFLVVLPGRQAVGTAAAVGGQIDVAPTLLAALGVVPPVSFVGRPLGSAGRGFAVLSGGSAVDGTRMFVASGPGINAEGSCFNFPDGAPLPLEECRALAARGREELAASRWAVLHDRVEKLAGRAASAPVKGES